jgi:hypothetical protein
LHFSCMSVRKLIYELQFDIAARRGPPPTESLKGRAAVEMREKGSTERILLRLKGYGDTLSIKDVADAFGCGKECVRRRLAGNQIKSVKVGHSIIVSKRWIVEYLQSGGGIRQAERRNDEKREAIVRFCEHLRSRKEIEKGLDFKENSYLRVILRDLIAKGRLRKTEPSPRLSAPRTAVRLAATLGFSLITNRNVDTSQNKNSPRTVQLNDPRAVYVIELFRWFFGLRFRRLLCFFLAPGFLVRFLLLFGLNLNEPILDRSFPLLGFIQYVLDETSWIQPETF